MENCYAHNDRDFKNLHTGFGMITNDATLSKNDSEPRLIYDPRTFIGMEFSLVPGVEQVFVEQVKTAVDLRVVIVVDNRNADVRTEIYEREKAVMDELANLDFDFNIVARQGRPLEEIGVPVGDIVFKR